ncbi:MAG: hypothetical protein L3J22_01445 [Xanthomonadales bacterium]|nr:hypothetical protein [Xanthomonadales bacterium]
MNITRKIVLTLSLLLLASSLAAKVKIEKEWTDENAKDKKYGHIAVYVAASVSMRREGFESAIARYLRTQGIDAFPSYILPNLSGKKLELDEVITSMANEEVDALITIYVVSVGGGQESEKWVRPNWGLDLYSGWVHPYSNVYTVSSGAYEYTSKQQQFYLESRLVDFSTRKPVWLMFTKTTDPEYRNTNKEFVHLLSKKLKQTNMLIID